MNVTVLGSGGWGTALALLLFSALFPTGEAHACDN